MTGRGRHTGQEEGLEVQPLGVFGAAQVPEDGWHDGGAGRRRLEGEANGQIGVAVEVGVTEGGANQAGGGEALTPGRERPLTPLLRLLGLPGHFDGLAVLEKGTGTV